MSTRAAQCLALHHRARRGYRHGQRATRIPTRSTAHLFLNVARWVTAAISRQTPPPLQDAVRGYNSHRCIRCRVCRICKYCGGGGSDEHRNAVRVRPRVRGGDLSPSQRSYPAPPLQGAVGASYATDLDCGVPLLDVSATGCHLDPFRYLARHWTRDLFRIRLSSFNAPPKGRIRDREHLIAVIAMERPSPPPI